MSCAKKKVLHIALIHGGGGVWMYTRMLINKTSNEYDNVLICSSDYDKRELQCKKIYEVNVPREIHLWEDIKAARRIRKIIKQESPDIIYCHSSMAGSVGRVAAVGLGKRVIYNPHGWSFNIDCSKSKKRVYVLIEKLLSIFAQRIVAISQFEKNIALEKRVCKSKKIDVILNGVDLEQCRKSRYARKELGFDDNDFVIACCARITQTKDPQLFARVAGVVAKKCPNARFMWIGDGEEKNFLEESLRENNVYDKTKLTGMVDNPCNYISVCDVAVLFSQWEGFGLSLVEYLALGKPVVATKAGGISEVVQDGVCGRVIDSRDENVLADAILSYKDRSVRDRMKQKCISRAELFSVDNTVNNTKHLYQELLKAKK